MVYLAGHYVFCPFAGVIGLLILLWRRETMKRIRTVVGSIAGVL